MKRIKDITEHLDRWAPPLYAEGYDNVGLIAGDPDAEVKGIMVSLDCTEAVVDDAVRKGCNLIVSHHPIVFKGLKKLTGSNYVERTIIKAIRKGVGIYAIHTNLDNVETGVNRRIADRLGLVDCKILVPKEETLLKLVFFVPKEDAETVKRAVFRAGAGHIGNYSDCAFDLEGLGSFTPGPGSNPTKGEINKPEKVSETRVEVLLPMHLQAGVMSALRQAHPYEEVAYFISPLHNTSQDVGSGMIGDLPSSMEEKEFLNFLKSRMETDTIRYTALPDRRIERVAVCGGSGSFLLGAAKAQKADAFVTGDFKYHEFFDAESKLMIADIGHYESEHFTMELIAENIREKFSTFATHLTEVNTNPILYH